MPDENHVTIRYPSWLPPHVKETHQRYAKLSNGDDEYVAKLDVLTKLIECPDAEQLWKSLHKRNNEAEDDLWVANLVDACRDALAMPPTEVVSEAKRKKMAVELAAKARRLAYDLEKLGWEQSFVRELINQEYGWYVYEEFSPDIQRQIDEEDRPRVYFSVVLRALARHLETRKANEPRVIGRTTDGKESIYFVRKMTDFCCRIYGAPLRQTVRIMLRALRDVYWPDARISQVAPLDERINECMSYKELLGG